MTPHQIKERYKKAKAHAQLFRDLYDEAFRLCVPDRNNYDRSSPGQQKKDGVYDSTGQRAATGFVNRMQSTICPAEQQWAEFVAGEALSEEDKEFVTGTYQKITDAVFSYIHASNFTVAAGEMFMEVGVGTGAMLFLEGTDDQPFVFVTVPITDIAIEEDAYGNVNGVYRELSIEVRNLNQYFKDVDMSRYEGEDDKKKIKVIEVTYKDADTGLWEYRAIDSKEDSELESRSYEENPWIILRWSKTPNEAFGRGPFVQALPDLKTANKLREMSLRQLNLTALGVYTGIDSDIMNTQNLTIEPGVIIPVKRNNGPSGPTLQPLPVGGDINSQFIELERLEMAIKQVLLDTGLPPEAGAVRSATEIVERVRQLQVDIGASFGRVMSEFVQPIMRRAINILVRKGLLNLPNGFKLDTLTAKVQMLSPIAKVQRMADIEALINAIQMSYGIDPQGQGVQMVYNLEEAHRYIAEKLGVDSTLIRTRDEVAQVKEEMAQAMAAQQQLEAQAQ